MKAAQALQAELVIECADESVASALNDVLMPDNRYFPKDQRFEASKSAASITFKVSSPRVRPALSTLGSIVSDARLFRDVWAYSRATGPTAARRREPAC